MSQIALQAPFTCAAPSLPLLSSLAALCATFAVVAVVVLSLATLALLGCPDDQSEDGLQSACGTTYLNLQTAAAPTCAAHARGLVQGSVFPGGDYAATVMLDHTSAFTSLCCRVCGAHRPPTKGGCAPRQQYALRGVRRVLGLRRSYGVFEPLFRHGRQPSKQSFGGYVPVEGRASSFGRLDCRPSARHMVDRCRLSEVSALPHHCMRVQLLGQPLGGKGMRWAWRVAGLVGDETA